LAQSSFFSIFGVAAELNVPIAFDFVTLPNLEASEEPNVKPRGPMLESAISELPAVSGVSLSVPGLAVSHAGQHVAAGVFLSMHDGHFQEPSATANNPPQLRVDTLSLLPLASSSSVSSSLELSPSPKSQSRYQVANLLRDIMPSTLIFFIVCLCSSSH